MNTALDILNEDELSSYSCKPTIPSDVFTWREFRRDEFWRSISSWKEVGEETFLNHSWQERNAVTNIDKLATLVEDRVDATMLLDARAGLGRAPMSIRISPYILSLIDWDNPYTDPLRKQFLPLASELEEDHPFLSLDCNYEQTDSPVQGITHRYFDRALFLVLDVCPVYCRYCTRSYAVGVDTDEVSKVQMSANKIRWANAIKYIASREELEDIVVSGGDLYRLKPAQLKEIGEALLAIPHIRRLRIATKGPAVMPMKILSDTAWFEALTHVVSRGRALYKDVAVHTHFNHPNEITGITLDALNKLFAAGVAVRNLSVTQRGVNDTAEVQQELWRKLTWMNVRPYYNYLCDLVQGVEELRTPLHQNIEAEKYIRGSLSGPYVPSYVVDLAGGGGKRDIHSFEFYDRETGLSGYTAPSVKEDILFFYVDPLRTLSSKIRLDWNNEAQRTQMVKDTLRKYGFGKAKLPTLLPVGA